MKAISLWQPWASAMAAGSKMIESRSWYTHHRGPLAIHAAQRRNINELIYYGSIWQFCGALGRKMGSDFSFHKDLPFGAIVAVGQLIDCRPTEDFKLGELMAPRRPAGETSDMYDWTEHVMGNYALGRFGWVFGELKALKEPVPFKGKQGFFNVPDELLAGKY